MILPQILKKGLPLLKVQKSLSSQSYHHYRITLNSTKKMKTSNIIYLLAIIVSLYSCEEPYTPPTTEDSQQYVVEGYVESGEGSLPTYVLLTRSIPYLSEIGPDKLASLFVKDASVVVNDGDKDVTLTKLCVDALP